MSDPVFTADRLAWRFRRSGGAGITTRPYSSFTVAIQQQVLRDARLPPDDAPAVLCFRADDDWVLLTTKSVVIGESGGVAIVPLTSITNTKWCQVDGQNKLAWYQIAITLEDGRRYLLSFDPGQPCCGFFNALRAAMPRRD